MILMSNIPFKMDCERLDFFRKRSESLRIEIEKNMSTNKSDSGVVKLDSSIGRLSRMDALQNQQIALELKRRQENQLLRIKNAIKRMDKGQYGLCGRCKKPIEDDRLEVFQDTFTCINCA